MSSKLNDEQKWLELCTSYRCWQEMATKGKLKMRKKIDKKNKQYYDFDFSKFQFYYSYPVQHISFASPSIQNQFIQDLIQKFTEDFSEKYIDCPQQLHPTSILKQFQKQACPYTFHDFLEDFIQSIEQQLKLLRLQKTLLMHFETNVEPSYIELIQSEIRSLIIKMNKIVGQGKLGHRIEKRLNDFKCNLKIRNYDEMQFTNLTKGDFTVFLRLMSTKNHLAYNMQKLLSQLKVDTCNQQIFIQRQSKLKKTQRISKKIKQNFDLQMYIKDIVEKGLTRRQPAHFENSFNGIFFQDFITKFNYMEKLNQDNKLKLSNLFPYYDGKKYYSQIPYIPSNQQQLNKIIRQTCMYFFQEQLFENLLKGTKQHLCYKINNLVTIMFRIMSETYSLISPVQQKQLINIRGVLKKQIQSVFSQDYSKLLNLQIHQTISLVDKGSATIPGFQPCNQCESSVICKRILTKSDNFIDSLIHSILATLHTTNEKTFRQRMSNYATDIIQKYAPNKYRYLKLYYNNLHMNPKLHIIRIINQAMKQTPVSVDGRQLLYLDILGEQSASLDSNMAEALYTLKFLKIYQTKNRLLQILNGQLCLMYEAKYLIQLIKFKSQLPLQMTKQFLRRFTYSDADEIQPFDFVEGEIVRETPFPKGYKDTVQITPQKIGSKEILKISVRTINPQNPVIQGQKIIYVQTLTELQQNLIKIQQICSYLIEERQNLLNNNAYTNIVDRVSLIQDIIEKERQFQQSKLLLMMQYHRILQLSFEPETIIKTVQNLVDTFDFNYILQMNQKSYVETYENFIEIIKNKSKILNELISIQTKIEKIQNDNFMQKLLRGNFSHNMPEISSIYYEEQLTIEEQQLSDEESRSDVADIKTINPMTNNQIMSQLTGSSQYHLKTSFQQILKKNNITQVATSATKKDQFLKRNRKKLISDSVLGGMLRKRKNHIRSIGQIFKIIQVVNKKIDESCFDLDYCAAYTNHVKEKLVNFEIELYSGIEKIKPDAIQAALNDVYNILEKLRSSCAVQPFQPFQHYLCFNESFLESLIKNKKQQIYELRGLYILLNYVNSSKLTYLLSLNQRKMKYAEQGFNKMMVKFGNSHQSQLPNFTKYYAQTKNSNGFKLYEKFKKTESHLLAIDQYELYLRSVLSVDTCISSYLMAINSHFNNYVISYENVLDQLTGILNGNCYFLGIFETLIGNPKHAFHNKVFISKKIQMMEGYKNQILKKQIVKDYCILLNEIFTKHSVGSFVEHDKFTVKNLLSNARKFKESIMNNFKSSYEIQLYTHEITSSLKNVQQMFSIKKYLPLLPKANSKLDLIFYPSTVMKDIFEVDDQLTNIKQQQTIKCIIQKKLKLSILKKQMDKIQRIEEWLQQNVLIRKYKQILDDSADTTNNLIQPSQYLKFYEYELENMSPYANKQVPMCPIPNLQYYHQYRSNLLIRQWLQTQLLIFGLSLESSQIFYYRILLFYKQFFPIFYIDNSENLVSTSALNKMKATDNSDEVMQKYIDDYYTMIKIKKSYQAFLQQLQDFISTRQDFDTYLFLYMAIPQYFSDNHFIQYSYLLNFGKFAQPKNQLESHIKHLLKTNPCYKLGKLNGYNFWKIAQLAWSKDINSKKQLSKLYINNHFNKININETRMKSIPKIILQPMRIRYKKQRLIEILKSLNIQTDLDILKQNFQFFNHEFAVKKDNNLILLNEAQTKIWKLQDRPTLKSIKFALAKEQLIKIIIEGKFYEKLFVNKFYELSAGILNNQCNLQKILSEDFKEKTIFNRDRHILKQTINTVLAPKSKINPFLSSPLKLNNYFISGSLKLSYIDSFLSKLKNRAVMVELAQGGFGFLLKVAELDDCVDYLCRSIIGFSEKQFSDRFRTVLQSFQDLKENYNKLSKKNKQLENIMSIMKQRQSKQIEAGIYEKLNDLLIVINNKDKSYQLILKVMKGLQNKYAKSYEQKYQQEIELLKAENAKLKKDFQNYRESLSKVTNNTIHQYKDHLYDHFKDKAERVLNKNFIQEMYGTNPDPTTKITDKTPLAERHTIKFQQMEEKQTQYLLSKLQTQKTFYEMKILALKQKQQRELKQLNKTIIQQKKLQNNLIILENQNKLLEAEVNNLQQQSISIQQIKRDRAAKQEQQLMQRFRLIRVNQVLTGKLDRLEKKSKEEAMQDPNQIFKLTTSQIGLQTDDKSMKKRAFRLKTQTVSSQHHSYSLGGMRNSTNQSGEVQIWRTKWQQSQRKFQQIYKKMQQAYQNFKFSKNYKNLIDSLCQMFDQQSLSRTRTNMGMGILRGT